MNVENFVCFLCLVLTRKGACCGSAGFVGLGVGESVSSPSTTMTSGIAGGFLSFQEFPLTLMFPPDWAPVAVAHALDFSSDFLVGAVLFLPLVWHLVFSHAARSAASCFALLVSSCLVKR